jgi:hypothetical protein
VENIGLKLNHIDNDESYRRVGAETR